MTEKQVKRIHETALHMFEDARQAKLPGYAAMLVHAAFELERRAEELEHAAHHASRHRHAIGIQTDDDEEALP